MCGIAGIFDLNQNKLSDRDILKKMSDVIVHRGPDSEGQWQSSGAECGLAFRRLAIIDLSEAGNQPMHSSDGRYTIVFNGEIYNHAEIREELKQKGYSYKSATDTETIMNGYIEWGEKILDRLVGMFAIAIWNDNKKELFCARDRIGIKPFYYSFNNGRFIFGSEIKSILQHPAVKSEMNLEQLPIYLNYGTSDYQNTLFAGINKLPAAHYIKINNDGSFKKERYWQPISEDTDYSEMSQEEIQEHTLKLLRRAVKDRMMSDVPFGVFLSGGIDSSLNVALMYELMDRPIDTYCVGFKELEKYNELKYARQIADKFNTNHHEILIDADDVFPVLEDLPWYEDEPNADPVCMPLYFLSKLTRESGTTVIQVGEGSDEQFFGYTWQMRDYKFLKSYWAKYKSLPSFMRKSAFALTGSAIAKFGAPIMKEYLRRASHNEELYWSGQSIFSPTHQSELLGKNYKELSMKSGKYANQLHELANSMKKDLDALQKFELMELFQRLPELLLMRVDKIGMAHSLEARVPFLDHRIVEFTMSLPEKMKNFDGQTTKYILKKAVEPLLPKDIIYRKKQGFWAPVNEWLKHQWYDYAYDKLMNSGLVKNDILDKKYIENLLVTHKNKQVNTGFHIYSLLNLVLWEERFNLK